MRNLPEWPVVVPVIGGASGGRHYRAAECLVERHRASPMAFWIAGRVFLADLPSGAAERLAAFGGAGVCGPRRQSAIRRDGAGRCVIGAPPIGGISAGSPHADVALAPEDDADDFLHLHHRRAQGGAGPYPSFADHRIFAMPFSNARNALRKKAPPPAFASQALLRPPPPMRFARGGRRAPRSSV